MYRSEVLAYAYDEDGRESATTYPGGSVAGTSYTARGQVAGIALDGAQVATYEYNLVGNMTAKTMENGVRTSFGYDAAHRLTAVEHRKGYDLLTAFGYTLDKVGNRIAKAQSGLNPLTENYITTPWTSWSRHGTAARGPLPTSTTRLGTGRT